MNTLNCPNILFIYRRPSHPPVLHLQIQPTVDQKYLGKNLQKVLKSKTLNLWHSGNYHSIYSVSGIISNPDIKYTAGRV